MRWTDKLRPRNMRTVGHTHGHVQLVTPRPQDLAMPACCHAVMWLDCHYHQCSQRPWWDDYCLDTVIDIDHGKVVQDIMYIILLCILCIAVRQAACSVRCSWDKMIWNSVNIFSLAAAAQCGQARLADNPKQCPCPGSRPAQPPPPLHDSFHDSSSRPHRAGLYTLGVSHSAHNNRVFSRIKNIFMLVNLLKPFPSVHSPACA